MRKRTIEDEYFDWLSGLVCEGQFAADISYKKLFTQLHMTEFGYSLAMDANRGSDGVSLRYRFVLDHNYGDYPDESPCSVLEMLVALAIRIEEDIMDDTEYGNRTSQWFWMMINNLRLSHMEDDRYDKEYVAEKLHIFLHREYRPDGFGGLFRIKNCKYDLRDIEIWTQMLWYLNTIT